MKPIGVLNGGVCAWRAVRAALERSPLLLKWAGSPPRNSRGQFAAPIPAGLPVRAHVCPDRLPKPEREPAVRKRELKRLRDTRPTAATCDAAAAGTIPASQEIDTMSTKKRAPALGAVPPLSTHHGTLQPTREPKRERAPLPHEGRGFPTGRPRGKR